MAPGLWTVGVRLRIACLDVKAGHGHTDNLLAEARLFSHFVGRGLEEVVRSPVVCTGRLVEEDAVDGHFRVVQYACPFCVGLDFS